jgi:hypothetical protein
MAAWKLRDRSDVESLFVPLNDNIELALQCRILVYSKLIRHGCGAELCAHAADILPKGDFDAMILRLILSTAAALTLLGQDFGAGKRMPHAPQGQPAPRRADGKPDLSCVYHAPGLKRRSTWDRWR